MSSTSQSVEQTVPRSPRQDSVVIGNQSYFRVLLRLIYAELYKLRRRTLSKVLSILAIAIVIIVFCAISAASIFVLASPAATFLPAPCTAKTVVIGAPCLDHSPTQAELDKAKHDALVSFSSPLRLPASLQVARQIVDVVGLVLMVIIAGTIVGGEYSVGTIRLMFTRGPTRTQFFLAKIGAVLICTVLMVIVMTLIGILTGALLNLITGIGIDFGFFNNSWLLHSVLNLLISMLRLFMFAIIALCFSTLGRATAGGIAGGLIWWGVEAILSSIFIAIGAFTTGALGDVAKAIPNYFIGNSVGTLSQNQDHYISAATKASSVSDLQALIVLAVYMILFIGVAWWVNQKRDVTN